MTYKTPIPDYRLKMASSPTTHTDTPAPSDLSITVFHHGQPHTFTLSSTATISDLSSLISANLSVPPENQKFLITPRPGLLKAPFAPLELRTLPRPHKITLLGSTTSELSSLKAESKKYQQRLSRTGLYKPSTPTHTRDSIKIQNEATYTFHTIRPLSYLPDPERARRFLARLRDDPGIRSAMVKHKFSVPLLTELDPAMHTTHDSLTRGLNRNKGEVIELRLRTDAFDGYRDYKTVRDTLCHELAHCVWGDHDRNFWNLTREIEKEVAKNDWKSGGHRLSNDEFYNPDDRNEGAIDEGGWTGGEFVLGSAAGSGSTGEDEGLSRREILARAAEERVKKQRRAEDE